MFPWRSSVVPMHVAPTPCGPCHVAGATHRQLWHLVCPHKVAVRRLCKIQFFAGLGVGPQDSFVVDALRVPSLAMAVLIAA